MSDDLEIRHGGVVSVDPEALRVVADALVALAPKFADAAAAVRRAHGCLLALPPATLRVDTSALRGSAERAEALHAECREAGENTRLMAGVFELVERRAELDALEIQGKAVPDALYDRIDELVASDPRMLDMEAWLLSEWEDGHYDGPVIGGIAAFAALGLGRIPPGVKLAGSGGPVSLTPVRQSAPLVPPGSLAEAFRRFPTAEGAQLKVEKYTMPDGARQFVLYSKGTQVSLDPDEPFDMKSNAQLYLRQESASYVATVEALEASGARAGDEVHLYVHSQAAMNAAYLIAQSDFDVTVSVTAGGPMQTAAGDDVLKIDFVHTGDIVGSLADGGFPGGTGSPDSMVITRDTSAIDLGIPDHLMAEYEHTAELVDESGDPRLEAWRDKQRVLTQAVSIESTEYVAKRE